MTDVEPQTAPERPPDPPLVDEPATSAPEDEPDTPEDDPVEEPKEDEPATAPVDPT